MCRDMTFAHWEKSLHFTEVYTIKLVYQLTTCYRFSEQTETDIEYLLKKFQCTDYTECHFHFWGQLPLW